ncbi:MAG TPA: hypothetical protein VGG12_04300 [Methylovirgula sp.]|jgi:hypothetical protein
MGAIKIQVAMFFLAFGLTPAMAQSISGVSCDDVRRLTPAEQDYWSHRLNLTSAMRHQIYVACYQKYDARHSQDIVANNSK